MAERRMKGYFLSLRRACTDDDGGDDGTAIFVNTLPTSFPCPNQEKGSRSRKGIPALERVREGILERESRSRLLLVLVYVYVLFLFNKIRITLTC